MSAPVTSSAPASTASDTSSWSNSTRRIINAAGSSDSIDRGLAVGPFEIEPRHRVRGDPSQILLEIGKPLQDPKADAAAARLVPGKLRPVEEPDRYSGPGEGPGGSRPGRAGADDEMTSCESIDGTDCERRIFSAPLLRAESTDCAQQLIGAVARTPAGSSRHRPRPTYTHRPLPYGASTSAPIFSPAIVRERIRRARRGRDTANPSRRGSTDRAPAPSRPTPRRSARWAS